MRFILCLLAFVCSGCVASSALACDCDCECCSQKQHPRESRTSRTYEERTEVRVYQPAVETETRRIPAEQVWVPAVTEWRNVPVWKPVQFGWRKRYDENGNSWNEQYVIKPAGYVLERKEVTVRAGYWKVISYYKEPGSENHDRYRHFDGANRRVEDRVWFERNR